MVRFHFKLLPIRLAPKAANLTSNKHFSQINNSNSTKSTSTTTITTTTTAATNANYFSIPFISLISKARH